MQRSNNKSDSKAIKILLVGNDAQGKSKFLNELNKIDQPFFSQKNTGIDLISVRIEGRLFHVVETLSKDRFSTLNEVYYRANDYQGVIVIADDNFVLNEVLKAKEGKIPFVNGAEYRDAAECLSSLNGKIKAKEKVQEKKTQDGKFLKFIPFFGVKDSEPKSEIKKEREVKHKVEENKSDAEKTQLKIAKSQLDDNAIKILLVGNDYYGMLTFCDLLSKTYPIIPQSIDNFDSTMFKMEDRIIKIVQTRSYEQLSFVNEYYFTANDYQGVIIIADENFVLDDILKKKQGAVLFVNAADYETPEECMSTLHEKIKVREEIFGSGSLIASKAPKEKTKQEKSKEKEIEKKSTDAKTESSDGILDFFKRKIDEFQVKRTEQPDPRKLSIND